MIANILKIFGAIFVAELGDKTQFAVLGFAASGKPVATFIGASAALVVITAIGAIVGAAMGKFIPQKIVQTAAGALFIVIGIVYLWKGLS